MKVTFNEKISDIDRAISACSYISGGFLGLIWQIFCSISKRPMSKFLLFNIYQSIFLSVFLYLAHILITLTISILIMIPLINIIVNSINMFLYTPVFYSWSIGGLIIWIIYLYLIIFSILGKIAYLPWVTNIILYQVNRF